MTRPGIEPQSPGPVANTLLIRLIYYIKEKPLKITHIFVIIFVSADPIFLKF